MESMASLELAHVEGGVKDPDGCIPLPEDYFQMALGWERLTDALKEGLITL